MGCDIHAAIVWDQSWPKMIPLDGEPRQYRFFGCLAGVRGECSSPVAENRGIPDWITRFVDNNNMLCVTGHADQDISQYLGDHSFSYCNADELEAAILKGEEDKEYRFPYWRGVLGLMRGLMEDEPDDASTVTLVFGFDS